MKRADFDAVVREFEPIIRQEGFTGSRGTYRLPDGVRFKFLLDKYGWDPMLGWGFLLDVEDATKADELGNVPVGHHLQVRPYTLEKSIGKKTLMKLYDDNPKLKSQIQGGWFAFDHADRLRDVLNTVLEPALTHIRAWSESKRETR